MLGDDNLFSNFEETQPQPKKSLQKKRKREENNTEKKEKEKLEKKDEVQSDSDSQQMKTLNVDYSLEGKIKQILDGEKIDLDSEDFTVNSYNFGNMIHDNICLKNQEVKFDFFKNQQSRAKSYEFKLDDFQERSIQCLENSQSVLVSAHTSAGKTVVAQYSIAMALRDKQRVIYTSPIKALSNQKYRELQQEFKDVGLMTGDVTINPGASCIVMTTEILRNMLYKGSEITREMAWVIFDEVHYMRDKERGVVWEETIILLPNTVRYVFLSATIPNASEFARWICRIKSQPCNVVFTMYRPTPLQHYVYVSGSEGIYLVVDEKGNFKESNYSKAISVLSDENNLDKIFDRKSKKKQGNEADIKKIITLIKDKNLDPAIIFAFSKKDCEQSALSLMKMDLTTDEEKELIEKIFKSAISTLSDEDQQLPQIQMMLPLLKKGIGVHHGGLLPIVKESVELIFQEGFLKALFSTETFSMGINMPAKTVVFTNIEKWDGEEYRWLTGGEYIQMSGRAGRRGIDDKGLTILMMNKKMDTEVAKGMLKGESDALYSSFHLNYNMIVNMLRTEAVNPEFIIKQSFHQFQSERSVPEFKRKIVELNLKLNEITVEKEDEIRDLIKSQDLLTKYVEELTKIVTDPQNLVPFLCPGRMLKIKNFGWGFCVNYTKKTLEVEINKIKSKKEKDNLLASLGTKEKQVDMYFVDVMLYVSRKIDADQKVVSGNLELKDGMMGVVPVLINAVEEVSSIKASIPHNLKEKGEMENSEKILREILKRFGNDIPKLDPVKDMEIDSPKLTELLKKIDNLKILIKKKDVFNSEQITKYNEKESIRNELTTLISSLTKCKETVLKDDLKNMKTVLRRLQLIDNKGTVLQKGHVAAVMTSADELLLTEMLYHGLFNDLEPKILCAVLSCFLTNEAGSKDPKQLKNSELNRMFDLIKQNADKVADILIESRININKPDYINGFKSDLMEVVYEWANGTKFGEICKITDIYEGSIIRCIRRLDELIRQLGEACQIINNNSLKDKLEKASVLIKRGIIFSASLYLNA